MGPLIIVEMIMFSCPFLLKIENLVPCARSEMLGCAVGSKIFLNPKHEIFEVVFVIRAFDI